MKRSKCRIEKLKTIFHKDKLKMMDERLFVKIVKNCFYLDNSIKLIQKQKEYYLENYD